MLNQIKDFITSQLGQYIILTIIALVVIGVLYYKKKKKEAEQLLLDLVSEIEDKLGTGQGDLKYASVVGLIYPAMSPIVRAFISQVALDKMIEYAVVLMKRKLKEDLDKLNATSTQQVVESIAAQAPVDEATIVTETK